MGRLTDPPSKKGIHVDLTDEQKKQLRAEVLKVKKHFKVTKVVCSRSVKGRNGDTYVGYSAAWDTIQDDAGGSVDLLNEGAGPQGMTLKDSKLASLILGMQVDIEAHSHAAAGGNLSEAELIDAIREIKSRYNRLIFETMFGEGNG